MEATENMYVAHDAALILMSARSFFVALVCSYCSCIRMPVICTERESRPNNAEQDEMPRVGHTD